MRAYLIQRIFYVYSYVFDTVYPSYLVQWLIYKLTGKSELERLCLARNISYGLKIHSIEKFLKKTDKLKTLLDNPVQDRHVIIEKILTINNIQPSEPTRLKKVLNSSIIMINDYKNLVNFIETQRTIDFSYKIDKHVNMLKQVWVSLKPTDTVQDVANTKWVEIGFQTNNPQTDFRGMGLLGLINLTYFTTNEKFVGHAKSVFSKSQHPIHWYSFAIVGINISSWVYTWLVDGSLKPNYFNAQRTTAHNDELLIDIENEDCLTVEETKFLNYFNYVYSMVFVEFDRFWFANRIEPMRFEQYAKVFRDLVKQKLDSIDFGFLGDNLKVELDSKY